MGKLLNIMGAFLKIGTIGFGGGSALIPVVEKEVVQNHKWIDEDTYLKHTVISNITPGGLPLKLGALTGYEQAGVLGSFLGAYSVTIPGILFTLTLLYIVTIFGDSITHYIEFASVGITIFIIYLLGEYIMKVMKSGKSRGLYKSYIYITIISFILTGGKEIRQVLSSFLGIESINDSIILFDISTINLMIITFFMIMYVAISGTKKSLVIGSTISVLYAIIMGKSELIQYTYIFKYTLILAMIALGIYSLVKHSSEKKDKEVHKVKFNIDKKLIISILLFAAVPLILTVISIIFQPENRNTLNTPFAFLNNIGISTITSFGGGEAYVAVADGLFVQGGYIQPDVFYSQVVPIANALPGPILSKIASAIGYFFGMEIQSVSYGILLAITVMSITIAVSVIPSLLVLTGYDALKDSIALKMMKAYILPVVCGMLISTSISMIVESIKITSIVNISTKISLPAIIILLVLLGKIQKKYHFNDLLVIICSALISLVVIGLI